MEIHDTGSAPGAGAPLDARSLDRRLNGVLDLLDRAGCGLGEAIDRIRHLSARRTLRRQFPGRLPQCVELAGEGKSTKRLNLDRGRIVAMRKAGHTFQEIADKLGCSIASVQNYLYQRRATRTKRGGR